MSDRRGVEATPEQWQAYADDVRRRAFVTKDSGERIEYESGMRRDVDTNKARFDLMIADGLGYEEQFLTRIAQLLARGADKYGDRNWEKANSDEEMRRFRASAFRHFMQWIARADDGEDHAAAVVFNLLAAETTKSKLNQPERFAPPF